MLDAILTPWAWLAIGIAVIGVVWFRFRRLGRAWVRALILAFTIAFFFTPFIPHSSIEWATPWPPASVWLILGLINGSLMTFEMLSIAAMTTVLWIVLTAIFRKSAKPTDTQ
jgi:hypothetical protein